MTYNKEIVTDCCNSDTYIGSDEIGSCVKCSDCRENGVLIELKEE